MPLSSGTLLGAYEVLGPLGAGGMGEVYRARDTRLGRDVAIKVLPANRSHDPQLRERFEREARAASKLNHPNICTVYDVGHQDGIQYLVMEFLEGESLQQRLLKGPVPMSQVLRYAVESARALDHAHRMGFIHRDLKPANIMLTPSGAKLLDFGLARAYSPADDDDARTLTMGLTEAGAVVGTIQYMAPEQLEGKPLSPQSDIFAFGTVLYEMITGRRAFDGSSQVSIGARPPSHYPAISPFLLKSAKWAGS